MSILCVDNNEEIVDLLSFILRRVLLQRGEKSKAADFEKLMKDSKTHLDPLSPRTTWSRQVVSKRSLNQYKDDWKFGKQYNNQVLASPDRVEIEKFRVSQKNVSFKLTSGEGEIVEHLAPTVPPKPINQPGWKDFTAEEKRNGRK